VYEDTVGIIFVIGVPTNVRAPFDQKARFPEFGRETLG
jgi:hypothetical protein